MTELKIIEQREVLGKDFKIYGDYENPLFLAKDVASWIEHSKADVMIETVDENEKLKETIFTSGQNREVWFLTEDGLYEVLMQSRKPIAKQFKKEVKVILKSIRKHGAYMTPDTLDKMISSPEFGIKLLTALKDEQEKNRELALENAQQKQVIAEYSPKVSYYDLILQTKDVLSASQIAKDYGKSAFWLNNKLKDLGFQYNQGGVWLLYQKHAGQGYTSSKTHSYIDNYGVAHSKLHTYFTQKGRLFIYELLKQNGILPEVEKTCSEDDGLYA